MKTYPWTRKDSIRVGLRREDSRKMGSKAADTSAKADPIVETGPTAKSSSTKVSSTTSATKKAKPTPRKRRASSSKSKAETATSLKADLKKIEARLDRADEVTRSSVQSLETVVTALQANLKTASATQKGQLTKQVNLLSKRLEDQAAQTRAIIRNELKAALSKGGLDRFGEALDTASAKLDAAEIKQADAIARVNKHLADMARAVDARFFQESEDRTAAIRSASETLQSEIRASQQTVESRVARVERDSADALTKVGETIELVHETLKTRQQNSTDIVSQKVNELAVQTQGELEAYQAKLDARLEEFEARNLAVGTGAAERVVEKAAEDFNDKLDGLRKRLTELEQLDRHTALVQPSSTPAAPPPPPYGSPSAEMPPNPVQMLRDRLNPKQSPSNPPHVSPSPNPGGRPTSSLATNPYDPPSANAHVGHAETASFGSAAVQQQPSHIPVEFNPEDLKTLPTPTAPPMQDTPPVLPFPAAADSAPIQSQQDGLPPLPPFQPPAGFAPTMVPPPATAPASPDGFETAPLPDAVYANPAYAEEGDTGSPIAVRIADEGQRKRKRSLTRSLSGSSALSGRNVKLAMLAAGVALATVLAARMILSGPAPSDPNMIQGAPASEADVATPNRLESGAISFIPPTTETADPIGNYAESAPVIIDSAELDTLEAAVEAGNSIAQFQMGLAKLESGDTEAGAALIRQSASANQPAALYRLAKLYEAGEGVPQDDQMARQLIERAARGGNRIAMHDLALYYTEGRGGVGMDMQMARSWFEQAARRGVVDSQFNLGVLAESNQVGDNPDVSEALFWYSVAANQGDQFAVTRRDTLSASQTPEQLAEIEARVEAFIPREIDAAANGIFNNVPWVSQTSQSGDPQVRQVQSLLSGLGYSVGAADGLMGTNTRNAIREFQAANGLRETGEISGTLIQRLANAAGA